MLSIVPNPTSCSFDESLESNHPASFCIYFAAPEDALYIRSTHSEKIILKIKLIVSKISSFSLFLFFLKWTFNQQEDEATFIWEEMVFFLVINHRRGKGELTVTSGSLMNVVSLELCKRKKKVCRHFSSSLSYLSERLRDSQIC
jgi:hypothetical protein